MRLAIGLFYVGWAFCSTGLMIRFVETGSIPADVIVVNQIVVAFVALNLARKELEQHYKTK